MKHIQPTPPAPVVNKPKVKALDRILSLVTIALIGLYIALTFFIVANFKNVLFAVRRPDIMEAARRVEAEENRQIEAKIKETRQETLKRILNPAVTNSANK